MTCFTRGILEHGTGELTDKFIRVMCETNFVLHLSLISLSQSIQAKTTERRRSRAEKNVCWRQLAQQKPCVITGLSWA